MGREAAAGVTRLVPGNGARSAEPVSVSRICSQQDPRTGQAGNAEAEQLANVAAALGYKKGKVQALAILLSPFLTTL